MKSILHFVSVQSREIHYPLYCWTWLYSEWCVHFKSQNGVKCPEPSFGSTDEFCKRDRKNIYINTERFA